MRFHSSNEKNKDNLKTVDYLDWYLAISWSKMVLDFLEKKF
ncbi:hypothetical protein HMPREF9013_0623 [Bulleidia extructa W1219]|uniref:Uncharacterized protein n=1 Tax=Bulleidia extructa W1219 TaxID=679192 RepID=D2MNT9_9FIRM|nr:hypothetical protein HMPREF9013_0623 [Bulleidia extructa W1219]